MAKEEGFAVHLPRAARNRVAPLTRPCRIDTVRAPAFLGGPQTQLFDYRIPVGTYIPPDSTIKTGLYRYFLNGQTAATAYVGNFNFRRTA